MTGAGRNMGRAIMINLAHHCATVFSLDCNRENLDDLVMKYSGMVSLHQVLRNWDETTNKLDNLGDIDGLVN